MSKILKSTRVINTHVEPQVSEWSFADFNYKQNLIASAQVNPEIVEQDEYYKQVIG